MKFATYSGLVSAMRQPCWQFAIMALVLAMIIGVEGFVHVPGHDEVIAEAANYDAGRVARGTKVRHVFTLHGGMYHTAVIKELKVHCGCISATCENHIIQPEHTTDVVMEVDTTAMVGQDTRGCAVVFENADEKPITLTIDMTLYDPTAMFSSPRFFFGDQESMGGVSRSIELISRELEASTWTIQGVQCSTPNFQCEVEGSRRIVCRALNSQFPLGEFHATAAVAVRGPEGASIITVPIEGRIVPSIRVEPEYLYLGQLHRSQLWKGQIRFRGIPTSTVANAEKNRFTPTIRDQRAWIASNPGDMTLAEVTIRVPAEDGFFEGIAEIGTGLAFCPSIRLQYSGIVLEHGSPITGH